MAFFNHSLQDISVPLSPPGRKSQSRIPNRWNSALEFSAFHTCSRGRCRNSLPGPVAKAELQMLQFPRKFPRNPGWIPLLQRDFFFFPPFSINFPVSGCSSKNSKRPGTVFFPCSSPPGLEAALYRTPLRIYELPFCGRRLKIPTPLPGLALM